MTFGLNLNLGLNLGGKGGGDNHKGPDNWMPIGNPGDRRNDGPRNDGPRNDGPRNDGPRNDGPRNDGPRDGGRDLGGGKGDFGWGEGGGGKGGGLNLNLNVNLAIGSSVASLTSDFLRPTDDSKDADAAARLKRQSESADLESGRDARNSSTGPRGAVGVDGASAVRTVGGVPLNAPMAQAGGQAQTALGGQTGLGAQTGFGAKTGFGAQTGAAVTGGPAGLTVSVGANAGQAGSGGMAATMTASPSSIAPPAAAAPAPVASGALDRLVTALTDQTATPPQAGRSQGAGGDALASPQQAQNRSAVAAQTSVAVAPAADPSNAPRVRAEVSLQAGPAQQAPASDPAARQSSFFQAPNAAPASPNPAPNGLVPVAQAQSQGPALPGGPTAGLQVQIGQNLPIASAQQPAPASALQPGQQIQLSAIAQPAGPAAAPQHATPVQVAAAAQVSAQPTPQTGVQISVAQATAQQPTTAAGPTLTAQIHGAPPSSFSAIAPTASVTAQTPVERVAPPSAIAPTVNVAAPPPVERVTTPSAIAPLTAAEGVASVAATSAVAPAASGAPIVGIAPVNPVAQQSPLAPVEAVAPVAQRPAGEALVARQVAAVQQTERTEGPVAAVRDLTHRLREMPSVVAAQTLSELQPTLVRAAESYAGQRVERVEGVLETAPRELPRAAMARAGADLAAALDAGSADRSSHVTEAVAKAIATTERSSTERVIAFGEAVAFGAGLTLPFAMIGALEEKGEHDAARQLEVALAGGLARLLQRLTKAVDELGRVAGPVAFEWSAWRASGLSGRELERRLRARLAMKSGLASEIDDALAAVESLGAEMARAFERLSRWNARTPEIVGVWREATASRKTAFAIAQSLGAQHLVAQELAPGLRVDPPGRPDVFSFEAARELYGRFGFDPQSAAELAEISLARNVAVGMAGGWIRARKGRDPSDEAAFARIVAFLKGDRAPSNRHIETVTFADLDPEGERPLTLVGAPLLDRYELMEAA